MSTSAILAELRHLLRLLYRLRPGPYCIPYQYRLRRLLTATIEALHALQASSQVYSDLFRHQLMLHQLQLVRQAIRLAPSIDDALLATGPPPAVWQQTHELLLRVLETTLATPPLSC